MKKFNYLSLFVFFSISLYFTQEILEIDKISEIEKKAFRVSKDLNTKNKLNYGTSIITSYDVQHYSLNLNINPGSPTFSGSTEIKFKALKDLTSIELDAKTNLTLSNFIFNGITYTTLSHIGNKVTLSFPSILMQNSINTLTVNYVGNVSGSSGFFNSTHGSTPISYTLSESFHSASWWVCKDDLTDKADEGVDVFISHPNTMKAGSNGTLQSVIPINGTTNTTHWKTSYPIVPYLVAIAVTNYVEYNNSVDISGTTMPIINYVYPESLVGAKLSLDEVPNYIQFFSSKVGDYPYKNEKYGHAQWNIGGGMEHATMSFVNSYGRGLIAHELAHQWFGDWVTCGSWKDIWLNEGFATYFAALVIENENGSIVFNNWKRNATNFITGVTNGSVYISNDMDATNEERIFDTRLSYYKGGMVLNMLRFKLGDAVFYKAIKEYLNDTNLASGFATTPDLISHFNSASGLNLQEFFNDWIYGEGHPIFTVNVDNNMGNIKVTVNQTSSDPSVSFFETPFEITFFGAGGQELTKKLELTSNGQIFTLTDVPFLVTRYTFNTNKDIICKIQATTLQTEAVLETINNLLIYPNPANNIITLQLNSPIEFIKIYGSNGQLIKEMLGNKSTIEEINISNLIEGTYLIIITSEGKQIQNKFIIKK